MKRFSLIILILFIADFFIDAFVANREVSTIRYITKGLLMPLLILYLLVETKQYIHKSKAAYKTLVVLALIFSFLGDIFLIKDSSLNFMFGIAAFLIAHILYIIFFCRIQPFKSRNGLFILISALLILSYVVLLDYLFWDAIIKQKLTIAVVIYSLVLGIMLFTAANVFNSEKRPRNFITYLITGALFFVASDTMIALNKFYLEKQLPGFYIMFTYCIAQFLIVEGAIHFIKKIKVY